MDLFVQDALKNADNTEEATFEVGKANIKVFGVGGGGNNMVGWLYKKGVKGAEIIAANTDKQHLNMISADHKILIGKELTRGLGCGGFPQKGFEAAQESFHEIKELVKGADMTFVCAGMGGGTGTGAAGVIAEAARATGSIVIGTVTMPFNIERARCDKAEEGLNKLRKACDTVIVIDNNRLVMIAGNLPIHQAFAVANELVATMIKGIVEVISIPSLVNLDFADVRAIMSNGGVAVIGVGSSDTNDRVREAVKGALANPLLDINFKGATGALIHVTGGEDMTLEQINVIGELVTETLDADANVIWGARVANEMKGKIMVMAIITGVKNPWAVNAASGSPEQKAAVRQMNDELGIEVISY